MGVADSRFLLVTSTLQGGGSERQIAEMANYWAGEGVGITLATWSDPDVADFYPLDSRVRRVHLNATRTGKLRATLGRVSRMRRLLRETRPDAVLSFLTRSNVPTILAGMGLGLRLVVSERAHPAADTSLPPGYRLLRRAVYPWADAIVAQTEDAARWLRSNCRRNALVIPNALRPLPPRRVEKETLVVALGRLTRQKGFDLLLQAFGRVAGRFPEWKVAILGHGPERANLLRQRESLGLTDRVTFVGHVRDVETWMARAGLVVQPSRFEGFPNVVLESMGMGAAVISANCPAGPADLIEDGVNGRLVPVEDVVTLASVMAELMSQPEARYRLGREALKVRERFRQESIMAAWKAVLAPGSAATRDAGAIR